MKMLYILYHCLYYALSINTKVNNFPSHFRWQENLPLFGISGAVILIITGLIMLEKLNFFLPKPLCALSSFVSNNKIMLQIMATINVLALLACVVLPLVSYENFRLSFYKNINLAIITQDMIFPSYTKVSHFLFQYKLSYSDIQCCDGSFEAPTSFVEISEKYKLKLEESLCSYYSCGIKNDKTIPSESRNVTVSSVTKTLNVNNDNASQIHNLNLSEDDNPLLPAISGENTDGQGDNNSSFFLSEKDNSAYICIVELLSGFPDVS